LTHQQRGVHRIRSAVDPTSSLPEETTMFEITICYHVRYDAPGCTRILTDEDGNPLLVDSRTWTRSRPMSPSTTPARPGLRWPSGTRSYAVGPDVPASSSTTTATMASPPGIGSAAWPQAPKKPQESRGGGGSEPEAQ